MAQPDDLRASIDVGAIVFAESKRGASFSAREFVGDFLQMAGVRMHEEEADEILAELVARGSLRQIGPGVFAAIEAGQAKRAAMEHPIFSEGEPANMNRGRP